MCSSRHRSTLRDGKDFHQGEQCSQPDLMVLAGDAFFQLIRGHIPPAGFHYFTGNRDLNAQKHISFPILAGAGFEEAGQPRHLGRVGMAEHGLKQCIHFLKDTLFA